MSPERRTPSRSASRASRALARLAPEQGGDAGGLVLGGQVEHHALVGDQAEGDTRGGKGEAPDGALRRLGLGARRAQEFVAGRGGVEQILDDGAGALDAGRRAGPARRRRPPRAIRQAESWPSGRLMRVSRAAAPMEGSASPRKPRVEMRTRVSSCSLEVAWRSMRQRQFLGGRCRTHRR